MKFVLTLFTLLFVFSGCTSSSQETSKNIQLALQWANLQKLPSNAQNVTIESKGSAMTREFLLSFSANEPSIRKWLAESPGTSHISPEIEGSIEIYHMTASSGAQFAELTYDTIHKQVQVRVYWS